VTITTSAIGLLSHDKRGFEKRAPDSLARDLTIIVAATPFCFVDYGARRLH
jgi:hypothetical protein